MDHDLRRARKLERRDQLQALDCGHAVVDQMRHNFHPLFDFHSTLADYPPPCPFHNPNNIDPCYSETTYNTSATDIGMFKPFYLQTCLVLTRHRLFLLLVRQRREIG